MAEKSVKNKIKRNPVIGIIANTNKEKAFRVISHFVKKLKENNFQYYISNKVSEYQDNIQETLKKTDLLEEIELYKKSDIIISVGGDGTMLNTTFNAQFYDKPVLGVNLGKLGFLVETNVDQIDKVIKEIKAGRYSIDERMIIRGECIGHEMDHLFAVNDIVIDKGGWPKMIEIEINVDEEYVTTFSADGLIIATPTGSTGYSISTGGPIVSPKADVITLSPISPHSLTMRPLVLPSSQEIIIRTSSLHKEIHVNCDGQRVFSFPPPLELKITKCKRSAKLVHTNLTNYFETLRQKLLWGVDIRNNFENNGE
jgi:NAD+ kinase